MKYNVQLCLDLSKNAPPGVSLGLFETELEAQAVVEGIKATLKYMNIPYYNDGNPAVWYEVELDSDSK